MKLFPHRFALLKSFIKLFILISFLTRLVFLIWNFNEVDLSFFKLGNTLLIGFLFDLGTISFFVIPYCTYLLLVPTKWHGNLFDKIMTYSGYGIALFILVFSFLAEITFWTEFKSRFNFIAVDYLVYGREILSDINASYPIPLIIIGLGAIVFFLFRHTINKGIFVKTYHNDNTFKSKLFPTIFFVGIATYCTFFVTNQSAEVSENRFNNEISKTGIYSFFAALRTNELPYRDLYQTIDDREAFALVNRDLSFDLSALTELLNTEILSDSINIETKTDSVELRSTTQAKTLEKPILKQATNSDASKAPLHPNVIFICVESLSSEFLNTFGSELNLTPTLDSLAQNSLFFNNIYATGTRTVRGLEAFTLSIPATPGRSSLKSDHYQELYTIGEVFKQQGYERNFFYGGDGIIDNMNGFFEGNGFNIIHRGRGGSDNSVPTERVIIEDEEVSFENTSGICDGDLYTKVLKMADTTFAKGTPFFNFVMTTSTLRPYTYPDGKIDIPSGTGPDGAVKYSDNAIKEFLNEAKTKPWFENTIFMITTDHSASRTGMWDLDITNYRIPALIFNTPYVTPQKVDKLCSQIDIFPTLFELLNWDYKSNLFGKDILNMAKDEERAFIGNYRKLGLLKEDKLIILSEDKKANLYQWNEEDNTLVLLPMDETFLKEATSYYQVADYLYRNSSLKLIE